LLNIPYTNEKQIYYKSPLVSRNFNGALLKNSLFDLTPVPPLPRLWRDLRHEMERGTKGERLIFLVLKIQTAKVNKTYPKIYALKNMESLDFKNIWD
jgi:hypothetical protein